MAELEPLSIDNLIDLLPERCRSCQWAQLLIVVTAAFKQTAAPPSAIINEIYEQCPGFLGEGQAQLVIRGIEMEGEPMIGVYADEEALENCPYYALPEDD